MSALQKDLTNAESVAVNTDDATINRLERLRSIARRNGERQIANDVTNSEESVMPPKLRKKEPERLRGVPGRGIDKNTESLPKSSNSSETSTKSYLETQPLPSSIPIPEEPKGDEKMDTGSKSTQDVKPEATGKSSNLPAGSAVAPPALTIQAIRQTIWQAHLDYTSNKITAKQAKMIQQSCKEVISTIRLELNAMKQFGGAPKSINVLLGGRDG